MSDIEIEMRGKIAILTLNRPAFRNALDEAAIEVLDRFFDRPDPAVRAVVLRAEGPHFCAGLDLREHYEKNRSPVEFMRMCQAWHRAFDKMQFGSIPIIAALKGAVVGGGSNLPLRRMCASPSARRFSRFLRGSAACSRAVVRRCVSRAS